jgi:diphosphomevalonate decarboxylase
MTRRVALAHPNIALAKYWGKRSYGHNLPAVPSLSVTLSGMLTKTSVSFEQDLARDELTLNGKPAPEGARERVAGLLDRLRARAGSRMFARVESDNDFPTASGLASSASAFAALAVAGAAAAGVELSSSELSDLARRTSVSAARSVFGGFAELRAGQPGDDMLAAEPIAPPDHWDLAVVVAVTREGPKDVGSTDGMRHTAETSPYFDAWVNAAPGLFARVKQAVLARDIEALGVAVEQSALAMHAAGIAAGPAVMYWTGATIEVLAAVRRMRASGLEGYATIDAGPHVKVVTRGADAQRVAAALREVPGVLRTLEARPGTGARLEDATTERSAAASRAAEGA